MAAHRRRIVIGAGAGGEAVARETLRGGQAPHPRPARTRPRRRGRIAGPACARLRGHRPSGKVFRDPGGLRREIAARQAFPDHHSFTAPEMAALVARAEADGLALVTTEKDFARIETAPALRAYAPRIAPVPVRLALDGDGALRNMLATRVSGRPADAYAGPTDRG